LVLEDQDTKQTERFDLHLKNTEEFVFWGQNQFTGIEWWNKIRNFPYPIRYHVEISQLMYGLSDNPSDSESIIYGPYNTLIPNSEGSNIQYPIVFDNARLEHDCVCYGIVYDSCKTGMEYFSKG
jgi:hypothetical protein